MSLTAALVMCTRNRPDDVDGALSTIAAQTRMPPCVAVIDSSSDDRTRLVVERHAAAWPRRSTLVHVTSEPSLSHQRRVGIEQTTSDIVLFVDDDVRLDSMYVAAVMQLFETDVTESIGGVGAFVTNAPARTVRSVDRWFGIDSDAEGTVLASGRNIPVVTEPKAPIDVDWLSGAAMSYRRAMLEREPPDEKNFPFEGEDVELSYRIRRHARLVVSPLARCVHLESQTNRIAGAAQVEAELAMRLRRVARDDRLSMRAARLAAYYQLVKYGGAGALTLSRRRWAIATGTARALRNK